MIFVRYTVELYYNKLKGGTKTQIVTIQANNISHLAKLVELNYLDDDGKSAEILRILAEGVR